MNDKVFAEDWFLLAYWRNRPLTAGEYLDFARELLQKLHQFDPEAFGCIYSATDAANRNCTCYDEDFADFDERVLSQLARKNTPYMNPDDPDDRTFRRESVGYLGFLMSFIAQRDPDEDIFTVVSFSAGATDPEKTNNIIIEFPQSGYPQFADKHYVGELFKLVVAHCEPEEAYVISDEFRNLVGDYDSANRVVARPVGWFTWVPDKEAKNYVPADIKTEGFANGTIITLCDTPPLSTDTDMVERARLLRDSLQVAGYLPPDPEADPDDINKLGYVINDGQT